MAPLKPSSKKAPTLSLPMFPIKRESPPKRARPTNVLQVEKLKKITSENTTLQNQLSKKQQETTALQEIQELNLEHFKKEKVTLQQQHVSHIQDLNHQHEIQVKTLQQQHLCFIQEQNHPMLSKYIVFKDTEDQEHVGASGNFTGAKELCIENEVIDYKLGIESFGFKI